MEKGSASKSSGFTLLELMLIVTIIGMIAAITIPNFTKLAHKSRRTEAYNALHGIAVAQFAYFHEHGVYAPDFPTLGFQLEGGVEIDPTTLRGPYYTYTLTPITLGGVPNANFRVTATGDIDPTDPVLDVMIIENQLTVIK
jgi:Tfp pilus assembly protein PilE